MINKLAFIGTDFLLSKILDLNLLNLINFHYVETKTKN